jgi:hypothetical protein
MQDASKTWVAAIQAALVHVVDAEHWVAAAIQMVT